MCVFLSMSSVISNHDKENHTKLIKYREHLDKQIILLSDRYQLPEITGIGKQIPWATDIRIKFVETYDKRKSTLSSDISYLILKGLMKYVEGRWWIDHKDLPFDKLMSELLINDKLPDDIINNNCNNIKKIDNNSIIIDTQNDAILKIYTDNSDETVSILEKYLFVFEGDPGEWVQNISITDPERVGVVESLSLSLLQNGHTLRVLTRPPPEVVHDGTISIVDNKLCIIARTEPVYKAVSRFGERIIWIDREGVDKLKEVMKKYDIDCSQAARKYIDEVDV